MPHVKSTLHTFLIHHFPCIKFHFPLKNFHFPHKTFYFPTNISFPLLKTLSFSLYLSHPHTLSLSLSLTHTHTDLDIHIHTHTHNSADADEERPARRLLIPIDDPYPAPPSPTPTRPVHEVFGGGKRMFMRSSVAVAGAAAFSSSRLRYGDPKALLSPDKFNRR